MKNIKKIALVGGSCGGKTSFMSAIESTYMLSDWHIMSIPETATELIVNGIKPYGKYPIPSVDFQSMVFEKQKEKEKIYMESALLSPSDNVLILCDRGLLDGSCFISEPDFQHLIKLSSETVNSILDRYDAVIHLVTAANGAVECYNLDNPARSETPEQAIIQDNKIADIWSQHKQYFRVPNEANFSEKMNRALNHVFEILEVPKIEGYQKKFIIHNPNIDELKKYKIIKEHISQFYLNSPHDRQRRIRCTDNGYEKRYTFSEIYYDLSHRRVKVDKIITEEEYTHFLIDCDKTVPGLSKVRYCLPDFLCCIDIFDFDNSYAVLEKTCKESATKVNVPSIIQIVKDVSSDSSYENNNIIICHGQGLLSTRKFSKGV